MPRKVKIVTKQCQTIVLDTRQNIEIEYLCSGGFFERKIAIFFCLFFVIVVMVYPPSTEPIIRMTYSLPVRSMMLLIKLPSEQWSSIMM